MGKVAEYLAEKAKLRETTKYRAKMAAETQELPEPKRLEGGKCPLCGGKLVTVFCSGFMRLAGKDEGLYTSYRHHMCGSCDYDKWTSVIGDSGMG